MGLLDSLFGGTEEMTSTSTTTVEADPLIRAKFLGLSNRAFWDNPFLEFGGQFGGLTPDELRARSLAGQLTGPNAPGNAALNQGIGIAGRVGSFVPDNVTAGQSAFSPVQTGNFSAALGGMSPVAAGRAGAGQTQAGQVATDAGTLGFRGQVRDVAPASGAGLMAQFMNPFQQAVIDPALADLERVHERRLQSIEDDAIRAGAFGGSAEALLKAEAEREFSRQAADTASRLRYQGFNMAAGLGQQEAGRALQAGLANQGVDLSAAGQALGLAGQFGLANAANRTQAGIANAANATQAAIANRGFELQGLGMLADLERFNASNALQNQQFNVSQGLRANLANQGAGLQGAGLNLQAGGLLGQLGGQQFGQGLQGIGLLAGLGQEERAIGDRNTQLQLDELRRRQQFGLDRLGLAGQLLGMAPQNTTQTTESTQDVYVPGFFPQVLGAGATAYAASQYR